MIVYVETSVLLRKIFSQPGALTSWHQWQEGYTSELTRVEGLRNIDRLRLWGQLKTDADVALYTEALESTLAKLGIIPLKQTVLLRASQSFPTFISTLDALYLSSALAWREDSGKDMTFLTHDVQLSYAVRALGMAVIGV